MRLISITEAADLLNIGRTTSYRLAKTNQLPCVRGFGPLRVHYEKLIQMIENEFAATLPDAGGVPKESVCRTKEGKRGGLASPRQMERTLDALLAPRTMQQPRL